MSHHHTLIQYIQVLWFLPPTIYSTATTQFRFPSLCALLQQPSHRFPCLLSNPFSIEETQHSFCIINQIISLPSLKTFNICLTALRRNSKPFTMPVSPYIIWLLITSLAIPFFSQSGPFFILRAFAHAYLSSKNTDTVYFSFCLVNTLLILQITLYLFLMNF